MVVKNLKSKELILYTALFLLCFLVNFFTHQNILVSVLNCFLLASCLVFSSVVSNKKTTSSIFLILLGALPIFTHDFLPLNIIIAAVLGVLLTLYFKSNLKIVLIPIIIIYLVFSALFINDLIRPPFALQTDRLIFSQTNYAIGEARQGALFFPYKIRLLLFNKSVYLYVLFAKMADLFSLKNIYTLLLVANLYPLYKGLVTGYKEYIRNKILLAVLLLPPIIAVLGLSVDLFNSFILLAPLFLYFIIRGFTEINHKIYYALFILSILIMTSPFK